MAKPKYEQERDANVKRIQEHFLSLGIPILTKQVNDVFTKKAKGLRKTVESHNSGSDIDYDPTSDIDNQSDSDDASDDLDNDGVANEVRCIT